MALSGRPGQGGFSTIVGTFEFDGWDVITAGAEQTAVVEPADYSRVAISTLRAMPETCG
jgi:hypothetical protein